jgi:hypothetical protein
MHSRDNQKREPANLPGYAHFLGQPGWDVGTHLGEDASAHLTLVFSQVQELSERAGGITHLNGTSHRHIRPESEARHV